MPVLGESIGGRYRLEAVIGRGGMSTVYRALDTVLERPVAIKLMHPAWRPTPTSSSAFAARRAWWPGSATPTW